MADGLVAPIFTLVGVFLGSGGTIANSLLTARRTSKDKKAEADLKVRLETRTAVVAETGKFVKALDGVIRNLAEYGVRLLTQHGTRDQQDEYDEVLRKAREEDFPNARIIADLESERKVADREFEEADTARAEALAWLVTSCDEVLATASSCEIVVPDHIADIVRTLTDRADLLKRTVVNNFWRAQEATWDTLQEQVFIDQRAAITSGIRNWLHGTASD